MNENSTGSGYATPFQFYIDTSTDDLYVNVGSGTGQYVLGSGVAVNDGYLHRATLVYNSTSLTYTLYLDGSVVDTRTATAGWTPMKNSDPITLGYWPAYGDFFNGIIENVQIYRNYAPTTPLMMRALINDGTAQQSDVSSMTVTSSTAALASASTFEVLQKGAGGGPVGIRTSSLVQNNETVVTLNFDGNFTQYGSLVDGDYESIINGSGIRNAIAGGTLDGAGNGVGGSNCLFGNKATDNFFRIYDVVDGSRTMDNLDFAEFRTAMNTTAGMAGYLSYFDFNDDGSVDDLDFAEFRTGMGKSMTFSS